MNEPSAAGNVFIAANASPFEDPDGRGDSLPNWLLGACGLEAARSDAAAPQPLPWPVPADAEATRQRLIEKTTPSLLKPRTQQLLRDLRGVESYPIRAPAVPAPGDNRVAAARTAAKTAASGWRRQVGEDAVRTHLSRSASSSSRTQVLADDSTPIADGLIAITTPKQRRPCPSKSDEAEHWHRQNPAQVRVGACGFVLAKRRESGRLVMPAVDKPFR